MLNPLDYREPPCPLCGGKEFYYPDASAPEGRIPVGRVIERVDAAFNRNDMAEAGRLLEYWLQEAHQLRDKQGELSLCNELVGYYRKTGQGEKALASVKKAMNLIEELGQEDTVTAATVLLNCATAQKAFGLSEAAMPLYEQAKACYLRLLPPEDGRFGGLYNNMALALVDLKRYSEAEQAYHSALAVMSKVENGQAETAITYMNMAHLYEEWGKTEPIVGCLKQAYELLLTKTLPHNGYFAFVCEKCAPSFHYFGWTEQADYLYQLAGEIYAGS